MSLHQVNELPMYKAIRVVFNNSESVKEYFDMYFEIKEEAEKYKRQYTYKTPKEESIVYLSQLVCKYFWESLEE